MSFETPALGALFEMSRDAVLGIENGIIVFANPAAGTLLGAKPGQQAASLLPEYLLSEPAERFVASVKLGGRGGDVSVARQAGLTLVSYAVRASAPPAPAWERALREMGSSLFTARLSMDAIINRVRAEDDPALRDYAGVLYQNYYRLKRLCQHMTAANSIFQDSLPCSTRIVNLGTLCQELCGTVDSLTGRMGVSVRFEAEDGLFHITADPDLIEIMLLNLLTNSLAHTETGGRVTVRLSRQGGRVILAVDDPGSGIAPEVLSELFGGGPIPKLTDTAAGAGLGLVVVRGIAERHGGALIMESREGKGTSLRVSLPVANPTETILREPQIPYRADGMNNVLTELSVLLDKSFYTRKLFD